MSSAAARNRLPTVINGVHYPIDVKGVRRQPVDVVRQLVDQALESGEQTFNVNAAWKRIGDDFVLGAGQKWFDLASPKGELDSSRLRYQYSALADPFTSKGDMRGLPDDDIKVNGDGNAHLLCSTYPYHLYYSSGASLKWVDDPLVSSGSYPTGTCTGYTGGTILSMCTNGLTVFFTDGADIWTTGVFGAAATKLCTDNADHVWYCKGRLIASDNAEIFTESVVGVKTTIWTHTETSFRWRAATGAPNGIYAAGDMQGNVSMIYVITENNATGGLNPPVWVTGLPYGETVTDLAYYGGLIIIATTKGIRVASIDNSSGFLTYGPRIDINDGSSDVGTCCLAPQGEFVWFAGKFGNSDFQSGGTSWGIGRLSLSDFTADLVPAWCPDLRHSGNQPTGVASFGDHMFMSSSGYVTGEKTTPTYNNGPVFSTGRVSFGTDETKRVFKIKLATDPVPTNCAISCTIALPDGTTVSCTNTMTAGETRHTFTPSSTINQEWVNITFTAAFTGSNVTTTPVIQRWSLEGIPTPFKSQEIYIPVQLFEHITDEDGVAMSFDIAAELTALLALQSSRAPVTCSLGTETFTAIVDGLIVSGDNEGALGELKWVHNLSAIEGVVTVKLITVET